MDNKAHVLSAIRRHVWAGTYEAEEIAIVVGEKFFPPGRPTTTNCGPGSAKTDQ